MAKEYSAAKYVLILPSALRSRRGWCWFLIRFEWEKIKSGRFYAVWKTGAVEMK